MPACNEKPAILATNPGVDSTSIGGTLYRVKAFAGVAFYAALRMRYGHFIWHLFVLLGTACHFIAVLNYASG